MSVFRWVDHTSELELELEGDSEEEVFVEALRALAELLDPGPGGEAARVEVTASAPDRATLLAEWLNELLYLAEVRGLVPERVERVELAGAELEALVAGRVAESRPLVKAVTYHRLSLEREAGRWRGTAVLDV